MKTTSAALVLTAVLTASLTHAAKIFDVRAYGAKGDGVAKDTAAIQQAVDAAHAAGGGTVTLRDGVYLSGTIFLKSHVTFALAEGAVLKGSPDRADYCAADAFPQNYASTYDNMSGGHLIVAADCTDIALRGPGRIDGNSAAFLVDANGRQWKNWKKGIPWRPGQMIYIVDCENVTVDRLQMHNSPYWTCFLLNSRKILIRGCRIRTEREKYRTLNGDGIDIDRCRDVRVEACDINTEDDCITLRASCARVLAKPQDCADVTVTRCRLSSACNAVRIGVGEGVIRNCRLSHLDIHNTMNAINVVSAYTKESRGADIRDIVLESIRGTCERVLSFGYGRKPGHAKEAVIRDITFRDVDMKAKKANDFREEADRPFKNIVFENCRVDHP